MNITKMIIFVLYCLIGISLGCAIRAITLGEVQLTVSYATLAVCSMIAIKLEKQDK